MKKLSLDTKSPVVKSMASNLRRTRSRSKVAETSVIPTQEMNGLNALASSGRAHVKICRHSKVSRMVALSDEDISNLTSYSRRKQLTIDQINEIKAVFLRNMKRKNYGMTIRDIMEGPVEELLRVEAQIEKIMKGKFNPREFYIFFTEFSK